jgi:hypothetical protein
VPLAQGFVFGLPRAGIHRLIDNDLAVRLKFRAGLRRRPDVVAGLVEVGSPVAVVDNPTPRPSRADPGHQAPVVLVDGAGRPVAMRVLTPGGSSHRPVVTATATEQVSSAADRAMSRPPADRMLPLVCVDSAGRHVGVIPIDALVRALAASPARPATVELSLP